MSALAGAVGDSNVVRYIGLGSRSGHRFWVGYVIVELNTLSLGLICVVAPYSLLLSWIRRSLWFKLAVVLGVVAKPWSSW